MYIGKKICINFSVDKRCHVVCRECFTAENYAFTRHTMMTYIVVHIALLL